LFSEKEEAVAGPASRVSRVLMTGPLAPFADAYAAELRERGYAPLSIVNELRQVGRLSGWLEARGLSAADLSGERVEQFLAWQRASGRHRCQWSRPGLACLLGVLRGLGVLAAEGPAPAGSPSDLLLASFERYLRAERGLAGGTASGYARHARRFLDGLPMGGRVAALTAGDVTAAVLREAASGVSVSATQYFVSGLRAFLRFCFIEGLMEADLSQAALVVTGRRRTSLPKAISRADAQALLGSCDRRRTLGRRDYAGELVVRGKGGRADRLPLPADVGEAIASYLRRGRPASERREVFLRARAPFEPIAPGTVSSTVRRACRRAGIARSARTGCVTRPPARWFQRTSRCSRSARCCGTAACRAPRSTRAWISTSCGCSPRRGPGARGDEQPARACR
jgi:integrase/recombinase XerD